MRKYIRQTAIRNKMIVFIQFCFLFMACEAADTKSEPQSENTKNTKEKSELLLADTTVQVGAARFNLYLPKMEGKRIAIVANQTSMVGNSHLVDTLISLGLEVKKVFALEHGFRGEVQAGETIKNDKDPKTGIPIVSLYGSNKKPKPEVLNDVDLIIFDIQDVGARFYTYISSLHYIMEAAAENDKEVFVFDRPNPNGFYVDGPILNMKHKSFVGMHPVPIVHGMTIGEYGQMINGEKWLSNKATCKLTVIPCQYYDHNTRYSLPIKPSPNLTNMTGIYLYPSICLFEGTIVSVARGTDFPFQAIGFPGNSIGDFEFTPKSVSAAKNPPHKDVLCKGYDLRTIPEEELSATSKINLKWLLEFYHSSGKKEHFFEKDGMFILLSGSPDLKKQILAGKTEAEIRNSWEEGLKNFKLIRKKYLLYKDFE